MQFERRKRHAAILDIAPLVDVIFLLLLFFMLTSRLVTAPTIAIDLPDSCTAKVQTPSEVIISLTSQGKLFLDDSAVTLDNLTESLALQLQRKNKPTVRLRADKKVEVGLLIHVVDCVKTCGCTAFNVETNNK